jgi:hypothetical protein
MESQFQRVDYSPAVLTVGSSSPDVEMSFGDVEEPPSVSGTVGMSVPFADAMAWSKGTLERPRKGMLREKRLAEGFKEDRVWLVSIDKIVGGETDSNGRADGSFGTWSSIDGGVRGEFTPACEPDGEVARTSASGDLDCDGETGENHLRAGVTETEAVLGGGMLSTRVSSVFGGVGVMTFVTGYCGVSGIGVPLGAGSIDGGSGGSCCNLLGGRLEDKDDVNQERLLGCDTMSVSGQPTLFAWESETGKLAGTASGRSSGGGAATAVVESVSTAVACSTVGEGGACLASSFKGTLEEPRGVNDASHERGCGTGSEPHGSGEGLVIFGSQAGGPSMSSVAEERLG